MHLLSLLHQEVLRHQCQKSWFRFSRRKMLRGEKHWPGRRSDRVAEQNQSSSTWHPHTWASPSPCPGGGPEVLKIVHKELSAVPWWGTPPWLDICLQRMWKPIPAPSLTLPGEEEDQVPILPIRTKTSCSWIQVILPRLTNQSNGALQQVLNILSTYYTDF